MRFHPLIFIICFLICSHARSQSEMIFEGVSRNIRLYKPLSDSAYAFNFEYLSTKQMSELCLYMAPVVSYEESKSSFAVFKDEEATVPYTRNDLRVVLIYKHDTIETEAYDSNGNVFIQKVLYPPDSAWYYNNIAGFRFLEDWIIDTARFTCEIKGRTFTPQTVLIGREDFGPMSLFTIKPATDQKSFIPVTDFIITDVFIKQEPMGEQQFAARESNTELDVYKLLLLVNTVIDKAKTGKITCLRPTVPFKKPMTTTEIKSLFTEEIALNKDDRFQVRHKLYGYRFKMVEKWFFDPVALAFKKEALGMVLMKRKEIKDLSTDKNGNIAYTFTPMVYLPFNKK